MSSGRGSVVFQLYFVFGQEHDGETARIPSPHHNLFYHVLLAGCIDKAEVKSSVGVRLNPFTVRASAVQVGNTIRTARIEQLNAANGSLGMVDDLDRNAG